MSLQGKVTELSLQSNVDVHTMADPEGFKSGGSSLFFLDDTAS